MRILLIAPTLLVAACLYAAAKDRPDFTGHWELNVHKSEFGKMSKPVHMTLDSERREGYMHSVQTMSNADGDEHKTEADWYPDGKPHHHEGPTPGTSTTRWDGDALVSDRRSDDGRNSEHVRLTMSADGRTAVEELEGTSEAGHSRSRLVWERK